MFIGFETVGVGGALIIPCSVYGDTEVALADVVLGAVVVNRTFIVTTTIHCNALMLIITDQMCFRATTNNSRITGICSATGNGNTSGIVGIAFCVLITSYRRRALVRTTPINLDTLILSAGQMSIRTAAKNRITGVLARSGKGDTSGVVLSTFAVFAAADKGCAFVGTVAGDGNALITLTHIMFSFIVAPKLRITLIYTRPWKCYTCLTTTLCVLLS